MKHLLFCLCFLATSLSIKAETYYTTKNLAEIGNRLNSAKRNVRIVKDDYGRISHIGYPLFPDSLIEISNPHPLLTFVERYFLELDLGIGIHNPVKRMSLDKVNIFKDGRLANMDWLEVLCNITPETPFAIHSIKNRNYSIIWDTENGSTSLSVVSDYQLLSGTNLIELEKNFIRDVQLAQTDSSEADSVIIIKNQTDSDSIRVDSLLIIKGDYYLNNQIRNDIYIEKNKDGVWLLRTDSLHSRQSVLNILATGQFVRQLPVEFSVKMYGNNVENCHITIQQLLFQIRKDGCQPYIGIKNISKDVIEATIFAYNELGAYEHVIKVSFPCALLGRTPSEDKKIIAEGFLYIPLHYV